LQVETGETEMFTVKLIQNGVTSVTELKDIVIARQGSESWDEDWDMAKAYNSEAPDLIECYCTPDPQDNKLMNEYTNVVDREGVSGVAKEQCIGILCLNEACQIAPAIPEKGSDGFGFAKLFLYKGDQLYVTNRYGATVEIVK